MYDLELIRERVSVRELAEEAGARFHGNVAPCPMPEHAGDRNHLAFSVFDGGRAWKCFSSCPSEKNGGDVFSFYMFWKGVDFKTAARELALRAGVGDLTPRPLPGGQQTETGGGERWERARIGEAPRAPGEKWQERGWSFVRWAHEQLVGPAGSPAREYLTKERGLQPAVWEHFQLGYCPEDYFDEAEKWGLEGKKIWLSKGIVIPGTYKTTLWYVKVRRPRPGDELAKYIGEVKTLEQVKFSGPRGGQATLFGADHTIGLPVLVLTEGEWDAMIAWNYGSDFCDVATLGGANNRADLLDLVWLARYPAIVAIYDNDKAGDEARNYWSQLQERLGGRIRLVKPIDHDLTDIYKHQGSPSLRKWLAGVVKAEMVRLLETLDGKQFPEVEQEWTELRDWTSIE